MGCPFCEIAAGQAPVGLVCKTETLMVFADRRPIREGHVQVIPRAHVAVFDDLTPGLAAEIVHMGQRLARSLKRLYPVERVGFVFTGNEVAHVHAHVLPLFASDDVTSARYAAGEAPFVPLAAQRASAARLAEALADG